MTAIQDTPVLIVDCQTTGSSPSQGRVLELGWGLYRAGNDVETFRESTTHYLLQQPDNENIPGRIKQITGISDGDIDDAVEPQTAWKEFRESYQRADSMVAHYAQFERSFLKSMAERFGDAGVVDETMICTHRIARRLLAGLPRKGIRALAGYLGHTLPDQKRTHHHVPATARIWRELTRRLREEHEVETLSELRSWVERTDPDSGDEYQYLIDRDERLSLPDQPGVYRMLDRSSRVLYVGKASSLHSRVNSYFQTRSSLSESKLELVTQVDEVDVQPTATSLEASLKEVEEIKETEPPYNSKLTGSGREIYYCSRTLTNWSKRPEQENPLGPFDRKRPVQRLKTIVRWIQNPPAPPVNIGDRRLRDVLRARHAEDGRRSFQETWNVESNLSMKKVMEVGRELWIRHRERENDEASEDEDASRSEEEPLTVEELHRRIESIVKWGTRAIRRSRWLRHIASSAVFWKPERDRSRPWKYLRFEEGTIKRSDQVSEASRSKQILQSSGGNTPVTVESFDRLRVLTTELKRLCSRKLPVRLQAGPKWYNGRELEPIFEQF